MDENENFKHDFINNALRMEIINKFLCEAMETNGEMSPKYIEDLELCLTNHLSYLEKLKNADG